MIQRISLRHNAMNIIIVLINWLFKNTMWAGDQKLIIDLEWPNSIMFTVHIIASQGVILTTI